MASTATRTMPLFAASWANSDSQLCRSVLAFSFKPRRSRVIIWMRLGTQSGVSLPSCRLPMQKVHSRHRPPPLGISVKSCTIYGPQTVTIVEFVSAASKCRVVIEVVLKVQRLLKRDYLGGGAPLLVILRDRRGVLEANVFFTAWTAGLYQKIRYVSQTRCVQHNASELGNL